MVTPYQPPVESTQKVKTRPSRFVGGIGGITAVAVASGFIGGTIFAICAFSRLMDVAPQVVFLVPALVWFGTLVALMMMLKEVHITSWTLFVTALGLTIPAYILYVPVCTVASLFTVPLLGNDGNYGPAAGGAIVGSVLASLLIAFLFAAILRIRFRVPVKDPSLESEGATQGWRAPTTVHPDRPTEDHQ